MVTASDRELRRKTRLVACLDFHIAKECSPWRLDKSECDKFTTIINNAVFKNPLHPSTPEDEHKFKKGIEDELAIALPNKDEEDIRVILVELKGYAMHCTAEQER